MTSTVRSTSSHKSIPAWFVLLIAALNGLIYVFIVPPWQNNDEMGQFEYAWLIANYDRLPNREEYDQSIRREILASMIENDFFVTDSIHANLIAVDELVWIGPGQVGGLPIYYWLLSIPLRLFCRLDVTFQLYILRLVSWMFFGGTIVIIKLLAEEIFDEKGFISFVYIFPSFLPGFISKMVAVNDDVAAVFFMTLYIWFGTRLLLRGWSIRNAIGLLGSLLLAFFTKQTTWTSIPFLLFVVVFGIFRQKRERLLVVLWILIFTFVLTFFIFWGRSAPAYYYAMSGGKPPLRISHPQSVQGKYVLEINRFTSTIYQMIDFSHIKQSEMNTLSVGFWGWSNQTVSMTYPQVVIDGKEYQAKERIELSQTPKFFAVTYNIEDHPIKKGLLKIKVESLADGITLYYDCLFLVPGDLLDTLPVSQDEGCQFVVWGKYTGKNIIRNGSFEKGWPIPRPFVVRGPISIDNLQLYNSIMGLLDPLASSDYLGKFFPYLFMTFWGRFGWGTIPYLGCSSYGIFIVMSIVSLAGFSIIWIKRYHWIKNKTIIYYYGFLFLAQLTIVYLREAGNWYAGFLLLPQARYLFPVIFPISVFFGGGWYNLVCSTIPKLNRVLSERIYLLIMMAINVWALITIWSQYH